MAITRAELSARILTLVNRDSTYYGNYTDTQINEAIHDCLTYVAAKMILSGDGWMRQKLYLNSVAGSQTVDIPSQVGMINNVRYRVDDRYVSLEYADGSDMDALVSASDFTGTPTSFSLLSNKIHFNVVPNQVGASYVMIECSLYPSKLALSGDVVDSQFDEAALNFVKWRAASQLVSQSGKAIPDWVRYEDEWGEILKQLIASRVESQPFIRDFA